MRFSLFAKVLLVSLMGLSAAAAQTSVVPPDCNTMSYKQWLQLDKPQQHGAIVYMLARGGLISKGIEPVAKAFAEGLAQPEVAASLAKTGCDCVRMFDLVCVKLAGELSPAMQDRIPLAMRVTGLSLGQFCMLSGEERIAYIRRRFVVLADTCATDFDATARDVASALPLPGLVNDLRNNPAAGADSVIRRAVAVTLAVADAQQEAQKAEDAAAAKQAEASPPKE